MNIPEIALGTVRLGSKGDNALMLQEDLNYCIDIGFLHGEHIDTDGRFESQSVGYLKMFQNAVGLPITGVYDAYTCDKMKEVIEGGK